MCNRVLFGPLHTFEKAVLVHYLSPEKCNSNYLKALHTVDMYRRNSERGYGSKEFDIVA